MFTRFQPLPDTNIQILPMKTARVHRLAMDMSGQHIYTLHSVETEDNPPAFVAKAGYKQSRELRKTPLLNQSRVFRAAFRNGAVTCRSCEPNTEEKRRSVIFHVLGKKSKGQLFSPPIKQLFCI